MPLLVNLISFLASPINALSILFAIALLLVIIKPLRKSGIIGLVIGAAVYFLLGSGPVAYFLMGNLEHRYSTINDTAEVSSDIEAIVILGGYAVEGGYFPVSSRLNSSGLFRVVEGFRLWNLDTERPVIIAGPEISNNAMAELLASMGMPESSIRKARPSHNTEGNGASIVPVVADKSFYLVTSAGHMPRAMLLFERMGLMPVPAPTDFLTSPNPLSADLLPSPFHFECTRLAIHEFLGILYLKLFQEE